MVGKVKSDFALLPGRIFKPAGGSGIHQALQFQRKIQHRSAVREGLPDKQAQQISTDIAIPHGHHMDNPGFRGVKKDQVTGAIDVITEVIGQGNGIELKVRYNGTHPGLYQLLDMGLVLIKDPAPVYPRSLWKLLRQQSVKGSGVQSGIDGSAEGVQTG